MGAFRGVPYRSCRGFLKSSFMDITLTVLNFLSDCVLDAVSPSLDLLLTYSSAGVGGGG